MQTYLLIGAGGTGTHLIAPALAYLENHHNALKEEWQFVIIDGDNYETKNKERQLFEPALVASNKAEAMIRMYNRYPVIAVPKYIGATDLKEMFQETDTVLIAADNHSIRALVQERALELKNCTVINAGNELTDGNIQLWIRRKNKNMTPKLSYLHPEIQYESAEDRAPMDCMTAAALPGGGQLILANQQAASWMLAALWRVHTGAWKTGWTELQFDLANGTVHHLDMRERRNWAL